MAVSAATASSHAQGGACGLPTTSPLWIEYGDTPVTFWKQVFARPGVIVGVSGLGPQPAQLRAAGAATVFFDLNLKNRVGTASVPTDPATIVDRANRLFDAAVKSSGCATPLIAENELFGASTTTPWSVTNAQYRANVLAFLTQLAARGARPVLLISSAAYTGGDAGAWWQQVARVSDIVREFFFPSHGVFSQGPILGSRAQRVAMRAAIGVFTSIGIPASRVGLMLEFESGQYGRAGLQPPAAWFEVVKLEALAAKQVARETVISTVWSWGWATFLPSEADPDKQAAACVYLWAREQGLCDGPAAAGKGFDSSLTEGQIILPSGVLCSFGNAEILTADRSRIAAVTGDPELASSVLLAWAASRSSAAATQTQVDVAERAVIAGRFGGSRAAYLAALAKARVTRTVARNVLADELRRARIEAGLSVAGPSGAAVAAFYNTYGAVTARLVATKQPADWLGGQKRGIALATTAPGQVFSLPTGRQAKVSTISGPVTLRPLGPPLPLAAFPLPAARASIAAALVRTAKDEAYRTWLEAEEGKLLKTAVCLADDLPEAIPADLTAFLPFLAL